MSDERLMRFAQSFAGAKGKRRHAFASAFTQVD